MSDMIHLRKNWPQNLLNAKGWNFQSSTDWEQCPGESWSFWSLTMYMSEQVMGGKIAVPDIYLCEANLNGHS
jgi:hypothetical protein